MKNPNKSKKKSIKGWKAWAVVKRGKIESVASDGWNFHFGVFGHKPSAYDIGHEYCDGSCLNIIPVLITPINPKKKR